MKRSKTHAGQPGPPEGASGRPRAASVRRETTETRITADLALDGTARIEVTTGVAFFDHLLQALARHAGFDLTLRADGDLAVDPHHTVEDSGIVMGQAVRQAIDTRRGIARFASIHLPMDDALVLVALDLSGRPFLQYDIEYSADRIGSFAVDLVEEFLRAFVAAAGVTLHVRKVAGRNSHHMAEAVFKGLGVTLRRALTVVGEGVPSTKGVL